MGIRRERMSKEFTKYHIKIGKVYFVVHHFKGADKGDPHDHPWGFTSFVVKGSYIERRYVIANNEWTSTDIKREKGTSFSVEAAAIHEIIELPEGECWTVVLPKQKERETMFWRFSEGMIENRLWNKRKFRPFI